MQGTMLNGWKVYLPGNDGRPLVNGRVCFYNASTSDNVLVDAEVWGDKELTESLGTVVNADSRGYLPTIWLTNEHLYKAVVQAKVSSYPTEEWKTIYEVDDLGAIKEEDPTVFSIVRTVGTIKELRDLPSTEENLKGFVEVLGVNSEYDIEGGLVFKWNPTSTESNLGYAFVSPSNWQKAGRWQQIFNGEVIDVRKFGAFPGNLTCLTNIMQALNYACNESYVSSPKTVAFVVEGNYAIDGPLDFGEYKNSKENYVHVVINEGVMFIDVSSVGIPTITIGGNVEIRSNSEIVGKCIVLKFASNSVDYVRPQWFYSDDDTFGSVLLKACSSTYNPSLIPVKVCGVIKNYSDNCLPSGSIDADVIWDSSYSLESDGSYGGELIFNGEFKCGKKLVFDTKGYTNWSCKFKKNSNIQSSWFSDLQIALDSVSFNSQVLVIGNTLIKGNYSNQSTNVRIDGIVTLDNNSVLSVGTIVNEDRRNKLFKIKDASTQNVRGKVLCNNSLVSAMWFIRPENKRSDVILDSLGFYDVLGACNNNAGITFDYATKLNESLSIELNKDITIESLYVSGEYPIIIKSNGKFSFVGSTLKNLSLLIEANELTLNDNVIDGPYVNLKPSKTICVEGNKFGNYYVTLNMKKDWDEASHSVKVTSRDEYDSSLPSSFPLSIECSRNVCGDITKNSFGDIMIKYDTTQPKMNESGTAPVTDSSGEIVYEHKTLDGSKTRFVKYFGSGNGCSRISVVGNYVSNELNVVTNESRVISDADFTRSDITVTYPGEDSLTYQTLRFFVASSIVSMLKNVLFDIEGRFNVKMKVLNIYNNLNEKISVDSSVLEYNGDAANLSGKRIDCILNSNLKIINDYLYGKLKSEHGLFDTLGTTMNLYTNMYHSDDKNKILYSIELSRFGEGDFE